MKNKLLYIIILSLLGFTSCSKYFEVDNSDRNTIPITFSTIEGFRSALVGTYGKVFDYYSAQSFYVYPEVAGNMVDITKTGINFLKQQQDFVSSADEEIQAVGYIWRYILEANANANNIIEYAPAFLATNAGAKNEIDVIKAQALFLRALAQFDLCRVYAQPYNYTPDASHLGIPVVLSNPAPEDAIGRSTVKQVYDQIIKELKEAETLIGTANASDPYFASKKSIQALLARVYLYSENWDEAIAYSTEVINNSQLAFDTDYTAMFNGLTPGKESIFRLNGKLRSNKLGQVYSLSDPIYVPADTLIKLFDDPADIRLSLFQANPNNSSKFFTKKWTTTVAFPQNEERYDPLVLRASEMYFIRAEANLAKNRLSQSASDLKIIIGRALSADPASIVLNETEVDLKRTIIQERAKEFCFEGHNFFDITRMKQNLVRGATTSSTVKIINYPSDLFVLPIPLSEIDANPSMKGNPTVNK